MIRAAGSLHRNQISHARCEAGFRKYTTFSRCEISSQKQALFRIANYLQPPPQTQRPPHNHQDHRIGLAAALLIMDLKLHPLTPQLQHHPNAHDERVILKFPPPLSSSVDETVQNIAEQPPTEFNVSPRTGEVSPPASRNPSFLEIDTPSLVHSMTVYEAKNPEYNE